MSVTQPPNTKIMFFTTFSVIWFYCIGDMLPGGWNDATGELGASWFGSVFLVLLGDATGQKKFGC